MLNNGCPCLWGNPCSDRCTCVYGGSSTGCRRCCTYGNNEQRVAKAAAIEKQEVEALAGIELFHKLKQLVETFNYES